MTSEAQHVVYDDDHLRALARTAKVLLPQDGEGLHKYTDTFFSVIRSCSAPHPSAAHQVAAWNTLSTFIEVTATSNLSIVRTVLWKDHLWQQSLSVFLSHSQTARPKSIKQLLDSLTKSVHATTRDAETASYRTNVYKLLIATVLERDNCSLWSLRPCMLLLSNLLRKDVLTLEQLSHLTGCSTVLASSTLLLRKCMQATISRESNSAAAQLLATLLDRADSVGESIAGLNTVWVQALLHIMHDRPEQLEAIRQDLMPVLFARDPKAFLGLINDLGYNQLLSCEVKSTSSSSPRTLNALVAALQAGRHCGLVRLSGTSTMDNGPLPLIIPARVATLLLQHADRSARIAGLTLLVQSDALSEPIAASTYAILKTNIPHLHADTDLNFRSELFSLTQKLLDRIRASTNRKAAESSLDADREFVSWYCRFLLIELRPSASYQRHISALRCLGILTKTGLDPNLPIDKTSKSAKIGGPWLFHVELDHSESEQVLVQLLLSPFDDIRYAAANILESFMHSTTTTHLSNRIAAAEQAAERIMLASGRADHADSVAHLCVLRYTAATSDSERRALFEQVLLKIQEKLGSAMQDLALSVQNSPLHGFLISLRYLIVRPGALTLLDQSTFEALVRIQERIWAVVKTTLCDDAPEGFLPGEMRHDSSMSSKAVLSFCWRALKEGSLLAESIMNVLTSRNDQYASKVKASIIELTFTQLAELRHRGAFSTVAQTWNTCCTILSHNNALASTFDKALGLIKKTTINTRRSAGMPSIICGILIADQSGELFANVFSKLDAVSRETVQAGLDDESSLPQVHAMNCLKDMLKNTRLAVTSEHYVARALQLAADSLPSKAWAIRNCGLMLFRAVIDRLLGTNDSYDEEATVKNVMDFRQRSPLLDQILLLLPNGTSTITSEGVFPALQLLQRALLPEDRKEVVCAAVLALLSHKSWLVRDKAAKTLITLMSVDAASALIIERLNQLCESSEDGNSIHGWLLCCKHLIRLAASDKANYELPERISAVQIKAAETLRASTRDHVLSEAVLEPSQQHACSLGVGIEPQRAEQHTRTLRTATALGQVISPSEAEAWLFAHSSLLESAAATDPLTGDLLISVQEWLTVCEAASRQDTSIFSTEIVAASLNNLSVLLQKIYEQRQASSVLVRICLLAYDLMQDDEEEVRMLATKSAARILSLRNCDFLEGGLQPLVASHKLMAFTLTNGARDPWFIRSCFCHAFDLDNFSTINVQGVLDGENLQDAHLFAKEKQNLYIDDFLEAKAWSRIIQRLSPSDIDAALIAALAMTVGAGFDMLIAKAEMMKPEAFDWSSRETVFVLGLRLIYGAEVLLHFSQEKVRLSLRPSNLREKVIKLQLVAERAELHPVWRNELARVANIATVASFSAIQSLVNGVVGRLPSATTL